MTQVSGRADRLIERLPRWAVAVLGVALVLVGGVLAVRPFRSMAVLVLLVVLALVLAGVGELVRGRWPWGPLRGVGQLGLALALLLWPGPGLGVLTLVVAASLLVDGVLDLLEAVRSPGDRLARWGDAAFGLAQVGVGLAALLWRDVALLVVAVALGLRLVVLGMRLLGRVVRPRPRSSSGPTSDGAPARGDRWRLVRGSAAVVGALALVVVGVLVQRGHPQPDGFYDPPGQVPAEPGRLIAVEPFDTRVPAGATAWRILYTTTRDEGVPAVASAIVVRPDQVAGPTPLVAWAHGTTGWAPGCAPSVLDEPWEAGAFFALDEVLAQGWSVVATDYVGLGTAGPHPYLIGQGEGRSVLDSVRAAGELDGLELDGRTVVWGHSQGGHAALWTGKLAPDYAPELRIDGVAALAPASNLPALVEVIEDSRVLTLFATYVVQAYASVYEDVRFADYVRPGAQLITREMAQRCLSEPGIAVSVGQALLLDRPIWDQDPTSGPFGARLAENVPTGRVPAPLLIGQGETDTLITPQAQQAYVADRCAEGQEVDYRTYPGRDHLQLVEADSPAMTEVVEWTRARLEGRPALDTC